VAEVPSRRITAQRIWKIVKALGRRAGMPELHPHAFRHGCGVELLKRSGGNLRAVQEHLRHVDIQTTTVYTRLQTDLQKIVSTFDTTVSQRVILIPTRRDQNPNGETT
jgi:site-specific recombinase XerD